MFKTDFEKKSFWGKIAGNFKKGHFWNGFARIKIFGKYHLIDEYGDFHCTSKDCETLDKLLDFCGELRLKENEQC